MLEKRDRMTSTEIDLVCDRFSEKISLCEEDVRKMLVEHGRLSEEHENEDFSNLINKLIFLIKISSLRFFMLY